VTVTVTVQEGAISDWNVERNPVGLCQRRIGFVGGGWRPGELSTGV